MVSFECLPLCYPTEPECCISVVDNMPEKNKIPYLPCVLELVFCKADQVVTTEESDCCLPCKEQRGHDHDIPG